MAVFPRIQSPCPYKSRLAEVMDGDMCRMCNRQVFDLSFMTDGERLSFFRGCAEEVCVSYRIPARPALAAAALAASLMVMPTAAAAQDSAPVGAEAAVEETYLDTGDPDGESILLIAGGIKDPSKVEFVEDPSDADMAELPVVYEEEPGPGDREEDPAARPVRSRAGF
jgi:predicted Fe-S protein YdhL (DUF1289 family)